MAPCEGEGLVAAVGARLVTVGPLTDSDVVVLPRLSVALTLKVWAPMGRVVS